MSDTSLLQASLLASFRVVVIAEKVAPAPKGHVYIPSEGRRGGATTVSSSFPLSSCFPSSSPPFSPSSAASVASSVALS